MLARLLYNPRLLLLCVALLLVTGLTALQLMPRLEDPRISNRIVIILTEFPGASAERVEALVTEKIENRLRELPELKHINSSSRIGLSSVLLELKDEVYEPDNERVWSRARDLLAEAALDFPEGVRPPRFDDKSGHAFTLLLGLEWIGERARPEVLGRYAAELERLLRILPGTEYVEIAGRGEEEIQVDVDPAQAASLGLSYQRLGQLVQNADAKVAAGRLSGRNQIIVEVAGELDSLERIRQIPLAVPAQGQQIRLGDIATVRRGLREPIDELALLDGQRGVVVAVRMEASQRIDKWTASVNTSLDRFAARLPANIELSTLFRQNDYTSTRLQRLAMNLTIGLALIVAVLLVTLGWRAALIVGGTLPLMVAFTFSGLWLVGLEVHQMSVAGIIVALGIMVDNAIVMCDTVAQQRATGRDGRAAVSAALRHLWLPLLGSTLTTMLAFLPIVLMAGPASEFVAPLGITVVLSLAGSFLISHSLVAAGAGRLIEPPAAQPHWYQHGWRPDGLVSRFRSSVATAVARPRRALLLVLLVPGLGFLLAGTLRDQFFPAVDRDMFAIDVYLGASASLESTREIVDRLDRDLRGRDGIERLDWFVGRSAPPFYYNLLRRRDGMQNFAQAMVRCRDVDTALRLAPMLQDELDRNWPEAQIIVRELVQGPPYDAPIELRLVGPDLDVLRGAGDRLRGLVLQVPDVLHARATLSEAVPRARFEIRDDLSRLAGLSPVEVSEQLHQALEGMTRGSVIEASEQVPLRIRLGSTARRDSEDLGAIEFISALNTLDSSYQGIPLTTLGGIRIETARSVVPRRNGERVNTIEVYVRSGVLASQVLWRIENAMSDQGFNLPPAYRLEIGGEQHQRNDAVSKLMSYARIILVLLLAVVVLTFDSFSLGGLIAVVGVAAVGLGLLVARLLSFPFSMMIILALIALTGLAINAAIVILAELKSSPEACRGESGATVEAVLRCGRHITSTTLTTLFGLLPLIMTAGDFWPPFATVMAGGTLLTTLLSFYLVPCGFSLLARRRNQAVRAASKHSTLAGESQ